MKTIEQHEGERRHVQPERYAPNGIQCPQCGKELRDVNRNVVLTTNPPRKAVVCIGCNWNGTVTA